MAPSAVGSKFAVVNVIAAMAAAAVRSQARLNDQWLPMAGFAGDIDVCAFEGKCGLHIVIKLPLQPVDRVMAGSAGVSESPLMRILLPVTVDAGSWRILEYVGIMATLAFHFRMRSEQREPRQVMIEEYVIRPRNLVVTVVADRALGAFVRIVVFVTGETIGLEFDDENRLDVALFALDRLVRAIQWMIRIRIVIERDLLPVFSNVAGLAGLAEMTFVVVALCVAGVAIDLQAVGEGVTAVTVIAT